MKLNYYAIANQIRKCRKRKKITQEQLSEAIGISPSYLSCVENGYKGISLETAVAIANALEVSLDLLLADNIEHADVAVVEEWSSILADCTLYEQRIILDTASAIKDSMRENRYLFRKKPIQLYTDEDDT